MMRLSRRALLAVGATALLGADARAADRLISGVNLAGLEFNRGRLPGRLDHDFVAPTTEELDYYRERGARAIRLPFLWERLQPDLGRAFDNGYWRLIDRLIDAAGERGMTLILDPHQYGRRRMDGATRIIGEDAQVSAEHFAAFWRALASRCRERAHVVFGLQNEPHDQDGETLVRVHNAAIAAIRATGAAHLILVPGIAWSGAHSWVRSGNARAMLSVRDPGANMAFEAHQYLDANSSGTGDTCVSGAGARLAPFTEWARQHAQRGFLGEFGAAANTACLTELTSLLDYMRDNRDVWLGWTCWGGGPWWPDDYPLRLGPRSRRDARDTPQMQVLRRYFE